MTLVKVLLFRLSATLFLLGVFQSHVVWGQEEALLKGERLAKIYCGSCHIYPSPSLLPNSIWKEKVLPQMAALMGDQAAQDSLGVWEEKTAEEIAVVKRMGVYPAKPLISPSDFQAIVDFYLAEAPPALPAQVPRSAVEALSGFTAKTLFIEGIKSPKTSLVAVNEERSELLISDAGSNQLYAMDKNDELFTLPAISSAAVHFSREAANLYHFITIGSISPSDLSRGALYEMDLNAGSWNRKLDRLARPVYSTWADLDGDGSPELLISNYGHNGGNISIYRDGDFQSDPLTLGGAGARKVEVADLNQDGRPDILALFCQGDERISVFFNKGNGQFEAEKILLRFSPLMGTSYFELQDLNGDGVSDLLVSNGDNWDYSSVYKPYHGFRIYLNTGDSQFEEAWFYPQYGAAKVMALDYDGDGDLDLATIAFYDELEDPNEQFLLFENRGDLIFQPRMIPEAAAGKWLTMDVGDLDGDGDSDIVLGSYAHNTMEYTKLLMRGLEEIPSVLILENNTLDRTK
ncbi:FG-GAP repeat domain-containing protein [Cyclobacterium lianum]|nr:VCBS repeat-containing protein [Cyclobacterium lianum]